MQNQVFVLDTNKQPLSPCRPSIARKLLRDGKAAVYRRYPFTLILKRTVNPERLPPVEVKIDPGSKTTGLALVQDDQVVFAAELTHRGQAIKDGLESRRAIRRNRRSRKTRYRAARFDNRRRPEGWLPPSIKSRVDNILIWVDRFRRLAPVGSVAMELVKFDMQLMQDAKISGVEYQQGELAGYQVREYLLEKWDRKCTYCGKQNVPLEVEHITPKSRGGSNSVGNLTLACHTCNQAKGSQTAKEFGFPEIQAKAKAPLKDAAAVNTARWSLFGRLKATGLRVSTGSGAMTKYNRAQRQYPKAHWIDAANVATVADLDVDLKPLLIKASGRGNRQMCTTDAHGFPCRAAKRKNKDGWQTGDMAKAIVKTGKYAGFYPSGRVIAKAESIVFLPSGWEYKNRIAVNQKYLSPLHRGDGYSYS